MKEVFFNVLFCFFVVVVAVVVVFFISNFVSSRMFSNIHSQLALGLVKMLVTTLRR